jgi:anti-anti-sigma factor
MGVQNQMRVVEVGAQFSSDSVVRVASEPVKSLLTVFDLSAVARIDWMALAMLADCRSRVRAKGGDLALVGVGPKLQQALRRLGIQEAVPVYDSVESARMAMAFGFAR